MTTSRWYSLAAAASQLFSIVSRLLSLFGRPMVLGCRWRSWGESTLAATPPPTAMQPPAHDAAAPEGACVPTSDAAATSDYATFEAPRSAPRRPPPLGSSPIMEASESGSSAGVRTPSRIGLLAPTPLSAAVDEECYSPHNHLEELDEFLAAANEEDYLDEEEQFHDPISPSAGSMPLSAASLESLGTISSPECGQDLLGVIPPRPVMRRRPRPGAMDWVSSPAPVVSSYECFDEDRGPDTPTRSGGMRRPRSLNLATPSSSSSSTLKRLLTPGTPLPERNELKLISGDVGAVFFDFDGTLTASPGDRALRCHKQVELHERAPLLAPRLKALREAGIILAILSKSSEATIVNALDVAGLRDLFDGPVMGKAVGLEGKAGFIEEICRRGCLSHLGVEQRALLVDDDVRELDRARIKGIQTYPAPPEGGLQSEDFDQIFAGLGIAGHQRQQHSVAGTSSGNMSGSSMGSSTIPPSPLAACGASLLLGEAKSPGQRFTHVPELPELPEFALEEAGGKL